MQQFIVTSNSPATVVKKNNEFLKTLDPKQFYNTTLNPLIIEDTTVEIKEGKKTTLTRTYKYSFTAMTTYFTPEDIPKENKGSNLMS